MAKDMLSELKSIEEALNILNSKGVSSFSSEGDLKLYDDTISDLEQLLKLIHNWLKKYILPVNSSFTLSSGYLLFCEKKTKVMNFEIQDIVEVIKEGMDILENLCEDFKNNPFLPEGKETIYKFLYVYNTLLNIYENSDDLKVDYDNYFADIRKKQMDGLKAAKSKEQEEIENRIKEAKRYFERSEDEAFSEDDELSFGNGYNDSVFIGYGSSQKVDPELASLARRILGIDISDRATNQPIYYSLNKESRPIVINCSNEDIEDKNYYFYLEELLVNFTFALPAKKIRFAGIECDASINAGFLSSVLSRFKSIYYNDKYAAYVHELLISVESFNQKKDIAEKEDEAIILMNTIKEILKQRRTKYDLFARRQKFDNPIDHANFFEFNKANPDSQDELIVLVINNYPRGFVREETKNHLDNLMKSQAYGVVVIMLQEETPSLYVSDDPYKASKYKLINDKKINYIGNLNLRNYKFEYNNGPISFAKNRYNKPINDVYGDIKNLVSKVSQFNSEDLFNKLEGVKYPTDEKSLSIPVGLSGDSIYNFVTSIAASPHGIVLGGTGSGKTAFLHTLILNGANMYSPDDLEFYLTDFKTQKGSGAFGEFIKGGKMYIPHVKYLALDTSPENVEDMFEMIKQIHAERSALIAKLHKEDFVEYNKTEEVRSGNKSFPKISRLCFIVDEYAEMIKNARKGFNITEDLQGLLQTVRTSGIFIILCGQTDEQLDGNHLLQIDRRILLKNYGIKNKREFIKSDNASELDFFLTAAGKGVLSMDSGKSFSNVNLCFSGSVGSSLMNSLCERVRNKYKDYEVNQIVAGDESVVDVSLDENLPRIMEEVSETDFNVYIGQGAVSFMPTAMRFATGQEDSNYFLTGGNETVDNAKRSIIMGFVSRALASKKVISTPVVHDCYVQATGASRESNCIKEYMDAYPILKKYVNHLNKEYEVAQTILKLEERLRKNIFGEPVLLMVTGANNISNDGEYASGNAIVIDEGSLRKEALARIEGKNYSQDAIDKFVEQYVQSKINQMRNAEPEPDISKRKVREALKNLYRRGHLVNVFVVLADGSYDAVKDFVSTNPYAKNYFLADRTDPEDIQPKLYYPSSCCHLMSKKLVVNVERNSNGRETRTTKPKVVSSKVKFYDYSLKYNKSWWDEFIKKL